MDEVEQSSPVSAQVSGQHWEDPEYDEEDRIREIDDFPEISSIASLPSELSEDTSEESEMRRILILQDLDDPIITEGGEEITLKTGDIEFCPSIIADTLIEAGIAEPADI